ncbi:MAG: HAMP domain-containing sensor histidine kinase [Chloroflexota bacterium]
MAGLIRQRLFSGFVIVLVLTAALIAGGLFAYFLFNPTAGNALQNLTLAVAMFLAIAVSCGWLVTRVPESVLQSVDDLERGQGALPSSVDAPPQPALPEMTLPAETSYTNEAITSRLQTVVSQGQGSNGDRLQFVDRVAHDLRAPLMAIQGYAVLMADPSFRMPHADYEKYGQTIAEQAGRMNHLIENAVTVTAIEENQLAVLPAPIRLGLLAEEVIEEARQNSGRTITLDDRLGAAAVMGDALRLRDVFLSLIDNAIRYSGPDAPIAVTLRGADSPGQAEFVVEDHGVGMADSDLPKLFQRFGRIKNESTQGVSGSGLSLYIARHVVERHQGRILVNTRPGEGTTFRVQLPLEKSAR